MPTIIAPSVLAADFANISTSLAPVIQAGADWLHLDIMDGSFVPPISFGTQMVSAINKMTDLTLDVHLMVNHPETHIQSLVDAGADWMTFHVENVIHSHRLIQQIKEKGLKAGIALVPSTPVSAVEELLAYVDLVLVMSVNPGYGGQMLIPSCIHKIAQLAQKRESGNFNFLISVDGGVGQDNAANLRSAGADVLVAGTSIFNSKNLVATIEKLRHG